MTTLAARLAALYDIGKNQLPTLGDQFGVAGSGLNIVSGSTIDWNRDPALGTGATGSHDALASLVDQISTFCSQTDTRLHDTGTAVIHAANDYAHTDGNVEAAYKKLIKDL